MFVRCDGIAFSLLPQTLLCRILYSLSSPILFLFIRHVEMTFFLLPRTLLCRILYSFELTSSFTLFCRHDWPPVRGRLQRLQPLPELGRVPAPRARGEHLQLPVRQSPERPLLPEHGAPGVPRRLVGKPRVRPLQLRRQQGLRQELRQEKWNLLLQGEEEFCVLSVLWTLKQVFFFVCLFFFLHFINPLWEIRAALPG